MSLTLFLWITLFAALTLLAFRRPAWGVSLYLLTFFASPPFWWWGGPIESVRWNLFGAIVLLVTVLASRLFGPDPHPLSNTGRRAVTLGIIAAINAGLVHVVLAPNYSISQIECILLIKTIALFLLLIAAIRDRSDLRLILLSLIIGAAYIGYEATINDRGKLVKNRLEGIGAPGAANSNELASLMVTVLPVTAGLLLAGGWRSRTAALLSAPLILNVVLLCNSRGAMLSAIASGFAFLLFAPPGLRSKMIKALALGLVALWLLLGDGRIVERFTTIFAEAEQRDDSAASRLLYWQAGINMIADRPFGSGGDGFSDVYGPGYIADLGGDLFDARSVHNGYLDETCSWGIQGLFLQLGVFITALGLLTSASRKHLASGDREGAIIAVAVASGLVSFLVTSIFSSLLSKEWGFWLAAIAVAMTRTDAHQPANQHTSLHEADLDSEPMLDEQHTAMYT